MSDLGSFNRLQASQLRERLAESTADRGRFFRVLGVVAAVAIIGGGWAVNQLRDGGGGGGAESTVALPKATGASNSVTVSSTSTTAAQELVVVQIVGAVHEPGVYELSPTARVNDAIAEAGGVTAEADIARVNLAAKVTDGQQIYVVKQGENVPVLTGGGSSGGSSTADAGPVNLNSATLEDLDALPGVGPSTAQAIIDYRESSGGFKAVADLNEVKGIGDAKFADLKDKVTV